MEAAQVTGARVKKKPFFSNNLFKVTEVIYFYQEYFKLHYTGQTVTVSNCVLSAEILQIYCVLCTVVLE